MRELALRARKNGKRSGGRRHAVDRLFDTYAQQPQREIPHLRKYPYKEGVETTDCQMPLHVYSWTLLAALRAAHELLVVLMKMRVGCIIKY